MHACMLAYDELAEAGEARSETSMPRSCLQRNSVGSPGCSLRSALTASDSRSWGATRGESRARARARASWRSAASGCYTPPVRGVMGGVKGLLLSSLLLSLLYCYDYYYHYYHLICMTLEAASYSRGSITPQKHRHKRTSKRMCIVPWGASVGAGIDLHLGAVLARLCCRCRRTLSRDLGGLGETQGQGSKGKSHKHMEWELAGVARRLKASSR